MSKVYSFRLDKNNPREAKVRELIEAWAAEGYSLRHVIVETLLSKVNVGEGQTEFSFFVEYLRDLILSFEKQPLSQSSDAPLSTSFMKSVKSSIKDGMKIEQRL